MNSDVISSNKNGYIKLRSIQHGIFTGNVATPQGTFSDSNVQVYYIGRLDEFFHLCSMGRPIPF